MLLKPLPLGFSCLHTKISHDDNLASTHTAQTRRHTRTRQLRNCDASKGVRKPSVPMAKHMTGGKGVSSTNRLARCLVECVHKRQPANNNRHNVSVWCVVNVPQQAHRGATNTHTHNVQADCMVYVLLNIQHVWLTCLPVCLSASQPICCS